MMLQIIVIFIASLWLVAMPANAQTQSAGIKVDQNFDHSRTKFPLEGAHKTATCEKCHEGGVFKGVPTACANCHNDDFSKGKGNNHPKTSNECANCHNNTNWVEVHVDHSKINTGCFTCHDGKVATGKSKTHVKSSKTCEDCHIVTTWRIAKFDHTLTVEPCESCHDRLHATGKPFVHIRSSNECATCHISTSWKIGVFDHTGIVDGCFTCHDGVTATGKSKNHLTTSNDCQNCHNTFNWTSVKFDHTDPAVAGVVCLTCHDGNIAAGKAITHYRTSTDCASCHTTVSWAPAGFDHASALFVDKCIACHDNKHLTSKGTAIGKNQNHLNTSTTCANCHKSFNNWKLATSIDFDHTDPLVAGATCLSCHNGTQSISIGPIVSKSNKHMPTSDTCDICHSTSKFVANIAFSHNEITVTTCFSCHDGIQTVSTAGKMIGKIQGHVAAGNNCELCHASFTTWKTSTFDHSVIGATRCATCHDGVSALGTKDAPSPGHLAFAPIDTDCGSCHTNFISFKPSKFDHTFASTNCVTCHDGVRKISNPKAMVGQNSFPNHIPTIGQACGDCHTSFTTWKTTFNHVGANGTCFSCHNGTVATGKLTGPSGKHILTSDTCENCHVNTTWVVTSAKFDHTDPMVVGQACFTCHNGTIATGKLSISGKHPVTSDNCAACHVTTAWTVAVTKFDHTDPVVASTSCETCHNGTTATGKSKTHILTLNTCLSCHTTASWLVGKQQVDHTAVIGTCFSCHDKGHNTTSFVPISGKTLTHMTTSNLCASCHTTALWKPAVLPLDHSQVFGTCFSCHDNVKATGRSNAHVKASTDCVLCHNTIAWTGTNVKFDHTDPVVAGATCVSCHNGSNPLAFGKASAAPPHIVSSDNCGDCHTTIAFKPAHIDHNDPAVVAQACSACHDGNHPPAVGKIPGHVATPPGSDCKDCHSTVTFVTSTKPDHTQPGFAGNCFSCHNGTTAKGKTLTHFATSNNCDLCHNTTLFKPATFDHSDTAVVGKACFTCHDGAPNHIPAMGKSSAPGGHLPTSNSCENCHASFTTWVTAIKFPHDDAIVMATPCATCHDGNHAPAVGKLPTHFQSSTDCGSCHVTTAWTVGVGKFNHSDPVSAGVPCFTCHNGTKLPAVGKIQGHVASSNLCGDCHVTGAWKPAKFDHVNVVPGTCFTCHNGTRATGKSNTHFATSNTCDNCHDTVKWVPALSPFNHADPVVAGAKCYSCHSGAKPPAVTKSNKHIASTTACETCHVTSTWNVALNGVDHSQVIGACFSCHNGTFATPSRTITPKSLKHFTTTNTCDACHTTAAWKPVAPTAFDHTQATGSCNSCHDGTHAPAVGKTPTHIKSTVLCDACHTTITWKPVAANKVDHTQVIGTCFTCHNGTIATGKSLTHIKTSTTCDACHNTVTWVSITIDHTQTVGACFTCHNATIATGKTSFGKHFNTSNTCESCHSSKDTKIPAAANWMVVKTAFDHTDPVVMAAACATCHTATATPAAADVKSPTHFITTQPCQVCHNTVNWTTLATYSHTSPAYVAHSVSSGVTTCLSCHKQNNEKITYLQPGLFPDCASCHSDKYKPDPHNKYGNVRYTFTELRDCTGACHIYKDATLTTIQTNRATNTKHRPTRSSWN